jgi:hypothetical protein
VHPREHRVRGDQGGRAGLSARRGKFKLAPEVPSSVVRVDD